MTDLILETFRLTGRVLKTADRMTRHLGLSSARWQVLGAIAEGPLPVAQIARNMGLQRQSVQPTVDALAAAGIVQFADNPNHRRAKLAHLTPRGQALLQVVTRLQVEWANHLARGTNPRSLADVIHLMRILRERLEQEDEDARRHRPS